MGPLPPRAASDPAPSEAPVERLGVDGLAELAALYRSVYPRHPSYRDPAKGEAYLRWRYFHGEPAVAEEQVLVVRAGGELVAARPVTLARGRAGGPAVLGVLSAVATAERHRGRGVFRRLSAAATELLRERGAALAWTFPNRQSYPIYRRRAGWEDHGSLPQRLAIAFGARGTGRGVDEVRVPPDAPSLDAAVAVERSAAWLRWRYLEHPLFRYRLLASAGGLVVVRRLDERDGALGRLGVVLELLAEPAAVPSLLAAARRVLAEDGARAVHLLSAPLARPARAAVARSGFVPLPARLRPYPMVSFPMGTGAVPGFGPRWYLSWGDTDNA